MGFVVVVALVVALVCFVAGPMGSAQRCSLDRPLVQLMGLGTVGQPALPVAAVAAAVADIVADSCQPDAASCPNCCGIPHRPG